MVRDFLILEKCTVAENKYFADLLHKENPYNSFIEYNNTHSLDWSE